MSPRVADAASESNAALLGEFMPAEHIVVLPRIPRPSHPANALKVASTREALSSLLH